MKKSLALLGCMAVIAMPITFNTASAQNGGAAQPQTSNYTGNHAPNNGTGGDATNPPSPSNNDTTTSSNSTTNYNRPHTSQTNYSTSDDGGAGTSTGNDNPRLNAGDKGGGQAR